MKFTDRMLQSWRTREAIRFIPKGARVVDVGAHNGELFETLGTALLEGFGIDPLLTCDTSTARYSLRAGLFPEVSPPSKNWDVITMLAVLEHIPRAKQNALAEVCHELLSMGGRVIVTVPSRAVDTILRILKAIGLIDGMSLEEHYGFKSEETCSVFSAPQFSLVCHRRFQLGLNNLYVFEKRLPAAASCHKKERCKGNESQKV